jgi:hypothetical protein
MSLPSSELKSMPSKKPTRSRPVSLKRLPAVFQRTTRRYVPEDKTLRNYRCENLKSYKYPLVSSRHRHVGRVAYRHSLRGSRDSSVGIATGYRLEDCEVGVRVTVGLKIFSSPGRRGPPSLLSNEYRGLFHRR